MTSGASAANPGNPTPMKSLKVCLLGKYYPPAPGGIETYVRTLARAQSELGASVRVLCVNHGPGPTVVEQDGPVEITRLRRVGSALKLDFCPELLGALRRIEADVLHLQVPNPTMVLALLLARLRRPLVVTYHSDVVVQKLRAAMFRPLERLVYRDVRVILPSSPTYPGGSSFLRPYAERIRVLPMGIDLKPYMEPSADDRARAVRVRAEHGRGGPLWLCAGRLVYYKGFLNAIRALRKIDGRLVLIGDGPDEALLRAEADRLGVADRVDFLGSVPSYLDIVPYYLAADAFWFPSNARSEAFGLVQVEAMASGCPVINTAIPHSGVSWVSPHEESGLTVPVNNVDAFAAAARRLLDEPGLRDRLVAGGRQRAVAQFDHRVMAERSLEIYRAVVSGSTAPEPTGRAVLMPSR
jgi:glycosyltransferase involved in cell wall biosynthesis